MSPTKQRDDQHIDRFLLADDNATDIGLDLFINRKNLILHVLSFAPLMRTRINLDEDIVAYLPKKVKRV